MQPDLDFVRARFPGLSSDWAFMDNAGGSHVLADVAGRVRDFLLEVPVQHGASYAASVEAREKVAQAVAALARMINAARPDEVVVGSSTTFLLQQLARALAPEIAEGDEILVTDVDHEANIGPWRALAQRHGAVLRTWRVDPESLELELDALDRLLTERTKLVCITHCSNILGTIMPVAEIARRVHAAGAELVVDGVAFAPHGRIDVQALGCDYYVYSLYKTFGPHQALLWGRHERLRELPSLNHRFIGREQVPYKFLPGNINYELAWGCGAIPGYLADLARHHGTDDADEVIAAHEEALSSRLLDYLGARNDVRIIGRREADRALRVPTISFTVRNHRSPDIVEVADRHEVAIRFGDFYARDLIRNLGLVEQQGVVRASLVHYNTAAEVDRLIAALDEALG
ncbi:cysteine desulfurase-like protein [Marinimicrococcus flavescens]|uniref:Cysteine desulfurase-like protein n=1 Tax=Marinimicrococcus flavescens TaxID=3031815 RepID=A0AAP4D520_9PROT|nr:cysteine desulfurase-like protein [Marinimicrococcus flavescens]